MLLSLPSVPLPVTGLDVWWITLPDINCQSLLFHHGACLGPEEHARLQSRRLPKGQLQFVFTRVLLRHLLSSYHPDIKPAQWQLGRSASGRPHVSPQQSSLSFNLAHTDNCLLFAFSQVGDPGVDLELIARAADVDAVAKRYFSAQEYAALQQTPEDNRVTLFYRLWTLKEAAVKASGDGLAKGLRRFQFSRPGEPQFGHLAQTGDYQFWSACHEGYGAALALMSRPGCNQQLSMPVSRRFVWPDTVSLIAPGWVKSQSRNSSTNLEP